MKQDTNHDLQKFISSQQMDNSKIQKRIINLGKALVKELRLEPGVDTLAKWMAHHIAAQMATAESATGSKKIDAERRCFETILKLWQHRSSLPDGQRPFENFEPIFHALERINPDNSTPYFYTKPSFHVSKKDDSDDKDEVQRWLDIAQGIDHAARVWLEYVFGEAARFATDKKTKKWLENAAGLPSSKDISIIIDLIQQADTETSEKGKAERKAKEDKLKSRVQKLDAFIELSKKLRAEFVTELKNLPKSVHKPRKS